MPWVKRYNTYKKNVGPLKLETRSKLYNLFSAHLPQGQLFERYGPEQGRGLVREFLDKDVYNLLLTLRIKPEDVKMFNTHNFDDQYHPAGAGLVTHPRYSRDYDFPHHEYQMVKYFKPNSPAKARLLEAFNRFLESKKPKTP
jgi:hypothetical protein